MNLHRCWCIMAAFIGLPQVLQGIGHTGNNGSVALLFKTHPHPDERFARLGDA